MVTHCEKFNNYKTVTKWLQIVTKWLHFRNYKIVTKWLQFGNKKLQSGNIVKHASFAGGHDRKWGDDFFIHEYLFLCINKNKKWVRAREPIFILEF